MDVYLVEWIRKHAFLGLSVETDSSYGVTYHLWLQKIALFLNFLQMFQMVEIMEKVYMRVAIGCFVLSTGINPAREEKKLYPVTILLVL